MDPFLGAVHSKPTGVHSTGSTPVEEHGLKAVIYLGDDVSDLDAFRVLRSLRAAGRCETLAVGVMHADSPARLLKSADVLVDGPVEAKAFIEYLLEERSGLFLAT